MIDSSRIDLAQTEIVRLLNSLLSTRGSEFREICDIVKIKMCELFLNTPLGSLDSHFIETLSSSKNESLLGRSEVSFWEMYKNLDGYTRLQSTVEKKAAIKNLKADIVICNENVLHRKRILALVKSVYISEHQDLIELFKQILPAPPLSIFEDRQRPQALVQQQLEQSLVVANFKANMNGDPELEAKIMYIQRHIRGRLRFDSDLKRIGERYFKEDPQSEDKALNMIQEANTPYAPQKCSLELSQRIMQAAEKITLYSSVSHLLTAPNIAVILDGFLYGRNNLLSSFINFRPAGLWPDDVENGDGNVICFGPDKIDPICLQGRTIGLKLDLKMVTNKEHFNDNPTIFFKQRDLGYRIGWQQLKIKDTSLEIDHTDALPYGNDLKFTNLQIKDAVNGHYCAAIEKDLMISCNVKEMDKIFVLNFFRFLDQLTTKTRTDAQGKIEEIYDLIASLDDEQLRAFLEQLGRKMSCTSEFNFSGAYKIDLNALQTITIYQDKNVINEIKISDLCEQLNGNHFELLDKLKSGIPEIFKSTTFIALLAAKVTHSAALEALQEEDLGRFTSLS